MSGDWISARDAREKVSPGCKFVGQTTEAICRYAAAGLVRAKAAMYTVEGQGQKKQFEDHLIPADFWNMKLEKEDWFHGLFLGVKRTISWEIWCEALGVTFERKGIEAMKGVETTLPASPSNDFVPTAKRGRPPGSGGFATQDKILVEKMREFIIDHPGTTPHFAAGQFAHQAAGNAGEDRKKRRLADRYREAYLI